jgi:hypothetical protein
MTDLDMPANTMKVQPDVGTVLANLLTQDITGPMKDYATARVNGDPVSPELAKAAYMQAKQLIDAAKATGESEVSLGSSKTISVATLEGLLADISYYAKVAASRQGINKLATKFEKLIK